jgi:4-amino-4-deoxy-L-arabinose transferase-like glycosyltransferase
MRKYLKLYTYEILAFLLIGLAVGVRLTLAALGWPLVNADEGTIAIAARHIAYNGTHPIYFYGYDYMGLVQSYIGAALFHLFGPSLFTLRLGLTLLYALLMLVMYFITSMLFTKPVALLTLAVMVLGSSFNLRYQLHAYGGYPEMLLFSAVLFLLALVLAFTYQTPPRQPVVPPNSLEPGSESFSQPSPLSLRGRVSELLHNRWLRLLLYICWGVIAGLGIWSHALIAPSILMSGLLILFFCWREFLWVLPPLSALGGLLFGLFPVLYYTFKYAAPGHNNVQVVLNMVTGDNRVQQTLGYVALQLKGTFLISVPTVSGNPFCPMNEVDVLMEPNSPRTPLCMTVHGLWSLGYLSLFTLAFLSTAWLLWRTLKSWRAGAANEDLRKQAIRSTGRLCLMLVGLITLAIYARSDAAVGWPANHARYLLTMLLATPCLLWVPWRGMGTFEGVNIPTSMARIPQKTRRILCGSVLAVIIALLVTGTVLTFGEVPFVQSQNHKNVQLIAYLEQHGVKHIYIDYWDCNSLAFLSEEKVQCAVVTESLGFTHNRYQPYMEATVADPYAAYVFRRGSSYVNPAGSERVLPVEEKLQKQGMRYQHIILDGFIVYLPEKP